MATTLDRLLQYAPRPVIRLWMAGNLKWFLCCVFLGFCTLGLVIDFLLFPTSKTVTLLIISAALLIATGRFAGLHQGLLSSPLHQFSYPASAVAITFDDGPHPQHTPELLEILRSYKAQATFFTLGKARKAYPDIIRSLLDDGHDLGSHGITHRHVWQIPPRALAKGISAEAQNLQSWGVHEPLLFRPPHGEKSPILELLLRKHRFKLVTWNLSSKDWRIPDENELLDRIIPHLEPGCIILMHDGPNAVAALPALLTELKKRDLRTCCVSDILRP